MIMNTVSFKYSWYTSEYWRPNGSKGECGQSWQSYSNHRQGRVYGGSDSKPGKIPFNAVLGYDTTLDGVRDVFYLCGGSVINKWFILSTANCLKDRSIR